MEQCKKSEGKEITDNCKGSVESHAPFSHVWIAVGMPIAVSRDDRKYINSKRVKRDCIRLQPTGKALCSPAFYI